MSKHRVHETITRIEAADRLANLAKQLREGTVSLGDEPTVLVADDIELEAELKNGKLELEFKWRKVDAPRPQPTAIA